MPNKREAEVIPDNFLLGTFSELLLESADEQVDKVESIWANGIPPPSIKEFLESSEWLDEEYDWETHTGARPVVIEQLEEIVKPEIREALLILGSGSGKGYCSSRLAVYMAVVYLHLKNSQRFYGFAEGDPIYIVNLALNKEQAKDVIFSYIKACVKRLPWLVDKLALKNHIGVDRIEFECGLTIISGDSNFQGFYGYNILMGVLDELSFYDRVKKKDGTVVDYASEGWDAITATFTHGNLSEHFKCIGITTAGSHDCFAETYYDKIKEQHKNGKGKDKYAKRLPTWVVKPNMTRSDFDDKFALNYAHASAKYGAEKGYSDKSYFTEDEKIRFRDKMRESKVENLYLGSGSINSIIKPDSDIKYFLHIDKAEKHDRLVICMGHLHKMVNSSDLDFDEDLSEELEMKEIDVLDELLPIIKIDLIAVIDPKGKVSDDHFLTIINNTRRINSPKVRGFIYMLTKYGYNIDCISYDSHESDEYDIKFDEKGYTTKHLSTDKNKSISTIGKTSMLNGRVICPFNKILSDELNDLIDTGRKIDHVANGYKDAYDAYSSVVYQVTLHAAGGDDIAIGLNETTEEQEDFVEQIRHNRYHETFRQLDSAYDEEDSFDDFALEFTGNDDEHIDSFGDLF